MKKFALLLLALFLFVGCNEILVEPEPLLKSTYTLSYNNDSEANAMLKAHAYLVQTAGFVSAWVPTNTSGQLTGYIGTTTDPAGENTPAAIALNDSGTDPFIYFFVPNGQYFEITQATQTPTIKWTPLVSGGAAPVDQD